MRVYFTGQRNFANRGCEALVRSTCDLLQQIVPGAEVLVPSDAQDHDRRQWPAHADAGVRFVPAYPRPLLQRLWQFMAAQTGPLARPWITSLPLPSGQRADLQAADWVLSLGGDMYSLDYGPPVRIAALDGAACRAGIPTSLWAASVGPFTAQPILESTLMAHLRNFTPVVVREPLSHAYLAAAGLTNLLLAADPAFHLAPEALDAPPVARARAAGKTLLGLNLSPIAERLATRAGRNFYPELHHFIQQRVRRDDLFLVLIPHVMARPGSTAADDYQVLLKLLTYCEPALLDALWLAPPTLNAAQYKALIGQCHYFIGARTHTTIAALSLGIPTLSLSYSVKAAGLNEHLLGNRDYVVPVQELTADHLGWRFRDLVAQAAPLRAQLATVVPTARDASLAALRQCCPA